MATFRDNGIVLRRTAWQEVDKLVHLYTENHGKIIAIAKGSRRVKSKLAGFLEPGMVTDFLIAKGKKYDHVAGCSSIEIFPDIRKNLLSLSLVNYLLEIVDKVHQLENPDSKIYKLLIHCFKQIDILVKNNQQGQIPLLKVLVFFKVKLLDILGLTIDQEIFDIDESSRMSFRKIREYNNIMDFSENNIQSRQLIEWNKLLEESLVNNLEKKINSEKFLSKLFIDVTRSV